MHQLVEGIDNEITFMFFFLVIVIAVVVPLYVLRPSLTLVEDQEDGPRDGANRSSSGGDTNIPNNVNMNRASNDMNRHNDRTYDQSNSGQLGASSYPGDGIRHRGSSQIPCQDSPSEPINEGTSNNQQSSSSTDEDLITIRIIHQESSQTLTVSKNMTLGDLKRQAFPSQHAAGQTIRLIFQGRVLNGDTYPLRYLGIMNGHVIHTSISDQPSSNNVPQGGGGAEDDLGLDLSALFVPLVAAMFSLLWTFVYFYSWLFSATSLLILGFLTLLFAAMTFMT